MKTLSIKLTGFHTLMPEMFIHVDFEKVDIMLISYLIYYHKDSD